MPDPIRLLLCKKEEVPETKPKCVTVDGNHFAIYRLGTEFTVIKDECPHQMASFEGAPCVDGLLTCGFHGWIFNLATGEPVKGFGNLTKYPVFYEGDQIGITYTEDESPSAYHASFIR